MRRRALLLLLAATGCGSRGMTSAPAPMGETLARPLEIYRDLGFITGNARFPAVGDLATLAGPADSTFVLLTLSLPNDALRFQRDGAGFFAEYHIELTLVDRDSTVVRRFDTRETVRVPTFAETGRSDESIVFQHAIAAAPGTYIARLAAADAHSTRGFRSVRELTVPDYTRDGSVSSPIVVYEAKGRSAPDTLPRIIANPRHTVPWGGDAARIYLESYRSAGTPALHVLNERGDTVWTSPTAAQHDGAALHYTIIDVPAEMLPVGRFSIAVSAASPVAHTPLIVTIADEWMAGSIDEVLQLLRFIAHEEEIDSLRSGSPAQQRAAWDQFWKRRDPLPITAGNEYRDQFFQRVRYAADAFREGAVPGWATDRGEVYIVLGEPDQSLERFIGAGDLLGQANAEEWIYVNAPGGRVSLLFHDRTGFGRFELVPSSAASFRSIALRLKSGTAS